MNDTPTKIKHRLKVTLTGSFTMACIVDSSDNEKDMIDYVAGEFTRSMAQKGIAVTVLNHRVDKENDS